MTELPPAATSPRSRGLASALLTLLVPIVLSLVLYRTSEHQIWQHEPIHSTLETAGGLLALIMVAVLSWGRRFPDHPRHLDWVMVSLACMGPLDLAHSCLHTGPPFFWSRALPTLLGGLLFALVWVPRRDAGDGSLRLPLGVMLLTLPLCVAFFVLPEIWPPMYTPGFDYKFAAKAINVVGGLGFLLSALFFVRRYRLLGLTEDLVFANHCILFGVAGLLFSLAYMWGAVWWLFHGMRLAAYVVVLWYVVELVRRLQRAQEEAVAEAVREQSVMVQQRLRQLEDELRAAREAR